MPGHGGPDARWARIKAEAARLVAAGGPYGTVRGEFVGHHVVIADPEGNELCVAAGSA